MNDAAATLPLVGLGSPGLPEIMLTGGEHAGPAPDWLSREMYGYVGQGIGRLDDWMTSFRHVSAVMIVWRELVSLSPAAGYAAMVGKGARRRVERRVTIGAMSGSCWVALEKSGHYRIGEGLAQPGSAHVGQSVRVALVVAIIGAAVSVGVLALRGLYAGW